MNKNKISKQNKKDIISYTILTILILFLLLWVVISFYLIFKPDNFKDLPYTKINPTYAIGGLNEDGTYLETKESIYTKDAFACYGLKTNLDFDNNISYRLFFYNEESKFLESTSKLTNSYDSSKTNMPGETKYCRIVITPNEDDKISWYEKNDYAKQLTIEVNKDQTKSTGVEKSYINYFEIDETKNGYAISPVDSFVLGADMQYTETVTVAVSKAINVSAYRHYQLRVIDTGNDALINYYFTDVNNKFVSFARFEDGASAEYIIEIPAAATYFSINYSNGGSAIINILTD